MADMDMKPGRELRGEELELITEAIVRSYGEKDLSRILRFKWGMALDEYVDVKAGFRDIVTDLVVWTEKKGRTLELLKLAVAENPGNDRLRNAAQSLGISVEAARQQYDPNAAVPKPANLEAAVSSHSRLVNFALFQQRLLAVGNRICRVETPAKKGTGFLVSPDLVLTNYHVVEEVIVGTASAEQTLCRFDYRRLDGAVDPAGQPCKLGTKGVIASSPYSSSDLTGSGAPAPGELDYALLALADTVGTGRDAGGNERGWFELRTDSRLVAMRDFVVIPQHAEAQPLEIAWGQVVAFPATGYRLRYDTTTEAGSSGSPCFTIDLGLLALHHAADPKNNPTYNQAVPLWLVARDLQAKGLLPKPGGG